MIANGVRETTTTSGTGTVTLSAVTGFARFSDAYVAGDVVSYAIKDGNNWEWGIGTIGAGNTLARTRIVCTYSGGGYSAYPAAGLTLSGSAAEVMSVQNNMSMPLLAPQVPADFGGCNLVGQGVFAGSKGLTANRIFAQAILCPGAKFSGAKVQINTAVAASKCRVGLYQMMADLTPAGAALIAETGDIDTSTTGYKSSSFSAAITLQPGWYFIAVMSDAAIGIRQPSSNMFLNFGAVSNFDFGTASYTLVDYAGSAGWTALPNPFPTASPNGTQGGPLGLTLTRA